MKTDEEVKATKDDVEMLKRPHLWTGGRLCLKRRATRQHKARRGCSYDVFGTIAADEVRADGVLFIRGSTSNDLWRFASAEAAVEAGWVVD